MKVKADQPFPADLLFIGTALEDGNCYIETGALDGEKNLKPKSTLIETRSIFTNDDFS